MLKIFCPTQLIDVMHHHLHSSILALFAPATSQRTSDLCKPTYSWHQLRKEEAIQERKEYEELDNLHEHRRFPAHILSTKTF